MPKGSEITLGYVHDWHRVERRNEWIDAVISQKSRNASKIKDNFDAITISGGFDLKTEERSRHTGHHRTIVSAAFDQSFAPSVQL